MENTILQSFRNSFEESAKEFYSTIEAEVDERVSRASQKSVEALKLNGKEDNKHRTLRKILHFLKEEQITLSEDQTIRLHNLLNAHSHASHRGKVLEEVVKKVCEESKFEGQILTQQVYPGMDEAADILLITKSGRKIVISCQTKLFSGGLQAERANNYLNNVKNIIQKNDDIFICVIYNAMPSSVDEIILKNRDVINVSLRS